MKRLPDEVIVPGICLLVMIMSLSAQSPVWKGTFTKDGDVVVVKNPKEPMYKDPIVSLTEDFSIGGTGAAGEYVFSYLMDLDIDHEGNIYVLDLKDRCIKVFDPSGQFLRKIGRRGQGPGELGGPFSMTLVASKNEIYVRDAGGGRRISVFRTDGSSVRQIPTAGMIDDLEADSFGNLFISESTFGQGSSQYVLKKMDSDLGRVLAELTKHPVELSRNPFKPRDRWILDANGGVLYGDAKSYELRYFSSEGKLVRRVLRDYELLKVAKEDIEEFGDRQIPGSTTKVTYDYSSHHAAYRSFFADDQGHLFVQTWERTPDRSKDIHDIFDAEGRFIGRVALSRHADIINPKPRFIRAGKLYTIEPDKDANEVVKRYSVEWRVK
jgi:hypothetical protein